MIRSQNRRSEIWEPVLSSKVLKQHEIMSITHTSPRISALKNSQAGTTTYYLVVRAMGMIPIISNTPQYVINNRDYKVNA